MQSTIFNLRESSRTFFLRHSASLQWARPMGGGPRTFPGGLNKWQWKRLHEKKAREKETRLLDHEKQLYQARLRSQIRASVSGHDGPDHSAHSHSPLSPKDHIKALADRFMKAGAVELWNSADGPVSDTVRPDSEPSEPEVAVRSGVDDGGSGFRGNMRQRRGYCGNAASFGENNVVKGGNWSDFGTVGQRRGYCGNESSFGLNNVLKGKNWSDFGSFGQRRGHCSGNAGSFGVSYVLEGGQLSNFSSNVTSLGVKKVVEEANLNDFGDAGQRRGYYGSTASFGAKNVVEGGSLIGFGRLEQRRGYATNVRGKFKAKFSNRRYENSSSDDEADYGRVIETARWPKFEVKGEGKKGEEEKDGRRDGVTGVRGFLGSGVLGKHDVKTTKRRILKELEDYAEMEEEGDLRGRIEEIRQEVMQRKLAEESRVEDENACGEEEAVNEVVSSGKRFDECGISPLTVNALMTAGYVTMSGTQEATLAVCLEGKDAFVKARAGRGKTVAFLLPAIEAALKAINSNKLQRVPPIYSLILCPTRELASQIAAEARAMLRYHDGIGVQMLVGGSRFKDDLKRLESDPCQILVATPGRLLDHIETRSALSARLLKLKMLVLDEADILLDLGFRRDIEKIIDCLPRQRQSLLFSATVPKEVRRLSQLILKREHVMVNTTDAGCLDTTSKVKQSYIIAPLDVHFQVVYQLLKDHISGMPDYKVIVFCTEGMVTSLMYLLLREMRLNVREIHSRKPQLYRSRIIDEFKQSTRLILISSDVSARGMNFPDVSLVVQVGIPHDREQYIDRLGRTGRNGKDGECILLLAPWEEQFFEEIKDLPVERSSSPLIDQQVKIKMEDSMAKIDASVKEAAYHGWLGYYNSLREIGRDKTSLVKWANQFCEAIGLQKPPALYRKTVVKMGLRDIPGIRIRK